MKISTKPHEKIGTKAATGQQALYIRPYMNAV